ncbi:MAG: hypothetical protein ABW136_05460 [Steroidobacteraceae bacterium]
MTRGFSKAFVSGALALCAQGVFAQAPGAVSAVVDTRCDRTCLLGFADGYMEALARKDPSRLAVATDVRFTENNVVLPLGEGVWRSIGKVSPDAMRAADVQSGNVSWFGVIEEYGKPAYYTMRMKVAKNRISEVETIISRLPDGPKPFGKAEEVRHDPRWNDVLPVEKRRPRERMMAIADGYFDTVELNDGQIFTHFADDCDRLENGISTTAPEKGVVSTSGCRAQFELGIFKINKRVRERRYQLVDEERGIVVATGFFDHANTFDEYRLNDGRTMKTFLKWPNSISLLEAFRINDGKIQLIEAVFTYVPYFMHNPWAQSAATPAWEDAPRGQACDVACLNGLADQYVQSLMKKDPSGLPWGERVRFAGNGVPMMIGDGLWGSARGVARPSLHVADPATGTVVWMGSIEEHGLPAHVALRLVVRDRRIVEVETVAGRQGNPGPFAPAAETKFDVSYQAELPAASRTPRARMADLVQSYYATLQNNDGTAFVSFTPQCRIVSNGVATVDGADKATSCQDLFKRGAFRPVERVRERQIRAIDEARGVVVASALLDWPAAFADFRGADGKSRNLAIPYPHSQSVVEAFRIENGRIARVEGVSAFMPYAMPPPWK